MAQFFCVFFFFSKVPLRSHQVFFFFPLRRKILAGERKQLIGSQGVGRSKFVDATSGSPPD